MRESRLGKYFTIAGINCLLPPTHFKNGETNLFFATKYFRLLRIYKFINYFSGIGATFHQKNVNNICSSVGAGFACPVLTFGQANPAPRNAIFVID